MTLEEVLQKMQKPEELVELNEMANIAQTISQFITDFELQYDELKMAYSLKWEEVKYAPTLPERSIEKPLTDKQTDIKMMRDPIYKQMISVKRDLGTLSRFRADLNRKMNIYMQMGRR